MVKSSGQIYWSNLSLSAHSLVAPPAPPRPLIPASRGCGVRSPRLAGRQRRPRGFPRPSSLGRPTPAGSPRRSRRLPTHFPAGLSGARRRGGHPPGGEVRHPSRALPRLCHLSRALPRLCHMYRSCRRAAARRAANRQIRHPSVNDSRSPVPYINTGEAPTGGARLTGRRRRRASRGRTRAARRAPSAQ